MAGPLQAQPLAGAARTAAQRSLTDVRLYTPRFHGDGRAGWDVLVTITFRDWAALGEHSEDDIKRRLYPDQERFRAEERRRFELLEAHWDVPLSEEALPDETVPGEGPSPQR